MRLVVYGTLKKGYGNNIWLRNSELINDNFKLVDFEIRDYGWFPVVNPKQGAVCYGELWEIDDDTLQGCDSLEGHPDFYTRIEVTQGDETFWLYQMPEYKVEGLPILEDGVWPGKQSEIY